MVKSGFEKSAQQAAVEAVERRWQRQQDAERRQRRRKTFGNLLAVVVLLLGVAGVAAFAARHYGIDIPHVADFDFGRLFAGWRGRGDVSQAEVSRRDKYARLLESFRGRKCILWRDAPKEIKPKAAAAGVRYLVLCEDRLYEWVSDGRGSASVTALSPLTEPIGLETKDFAADVAGKPFLLICNGVMYAVGCKDEVSARKLVSDLR